MLMKKWILFFFLEMLCIPLNFASQRYGETLCNMPDYFCMIIKKNESWATLFPKEDERDMVKRINRMNTHLRQGMILAVPKNMDRLSVYDLSPFPNYVDSKGEKVVYVSQKKLAWGAYNEEGDLLWWGPISSGMKKCAVTGGCETPTGSFRIIRKQDIDCISTVFPRRNGEESGGAIMPYCMHFLRGYALHGSPEVPGYQASHGCVRLFIEDARWLNEEFIEVPGEGLKGTRVILDAPEERIANKP